MLHHIIVKWNSNVDKKEMTDKVRSMYAKADEIPGVHRVEIRGMLFRVKIGMTS